MSVLFRNYVNESSVELPSDTHLEQLLGQEITAVALAAMEAAEEITNKDPFRRWLRVDVMVTVGVDTKKTYPTLYRVAEDPIAKHTGGCITSKQLNDFSAQQAAAQKAKESQ